MSSRHYSNDPPDAIAWHAETAQAALERLGSGADGLSDEEAARRLAEHGPNRLPAPPRPGPLARFLTQFRNILIYVLLASAVITALLGHGTDTAVILGVVVINALIGFVQEGKAEKALDAIRRMLSQQALVLRGGRRLTVPAEELVPGDVVLLQSGDKVPADLRLIAQRSLRIEEAALTGESVPVEKVTEAVAAQTVVAERTPMAFSGTLVTYGQGRGVVVATGGETELGRISAMLEAVQPLTTPLLRQMDRFAQQLSWWIVAVAVATFAFGVAVRGFTVEEMFIATVALAVAAIPEGLPAIITITLAIGVQRMARRNAIIRRLPAVETLGSVSVICTDKTGTLTRNEMMVQSVVTAEAAYEVGGSGYDPHGGFRRDGEDRPAEEEAALLELCRAALLCNDAALHEREGRWELQGDPTEGALLALGLKAGFNRALQLEEYPRTDAIPFESEHRFMATLHHNHAAHGFILVKGAPERVLEMCTWERYRGEERPLDAAHWQRKVEVFAARGQRLLALATRPLPEARESLHFDDVDGGLTLLGLTGLIDPPREEAIAAVGECREAGIVVKMITGDHAITARAIGAAMGIGDGSTALTGSEIEQCDEAALRRSAAETDVFARASPEHKLRLVQALQADGAVIAMTGDGVNDAPALRRADVGVAMGLNGTEVAKEAAEMVLADDNFASIAHAVHEGRTVYDNIKKSILFVLPTNVAEGLAILAAVLVGGTLPITPLQILWVNMVTAVTLALALAFEPAEANVMRRPPRPAGEPLLSPFLIWRILFVSTLVVGGIFGLFLWTRFEGSDITVARTVAVNTLVVFEIFYLLNTRHITAAALAGDGLRGNRYVPLTIAIVLVLQLLFIYLPPFQELFGTAPLDTTAWLRSGLAGLALFIVIEIEKMVVRRQRQNAGRVTG